MSFRSYTGRIVALSAVFIFAGLSGAQDQDILRIVPRKLFATVKNDAPPGANPLNSVYVTAGAHQLAFGLPEGFRVSPYGEKVMLVSQDNTCFLSFRLVVPAPTIGQAVDVAACRQLVLKQYPGARITMEYACRISEHTGFGYNLQWQNSAGGMQAVCVAYVPCNGGVVEVGLVTLAERFGNDLMYFKTMLASIRTNEHGAVQPATPPGAS